VRSEKVVQQTKVHLNAILFFENIDRIKIINFHTQVYPITNDGIPGTIFNGIPDWVYEGDF